MSAAEKAVALTQAEREALGYGIDYGTALAAVERILADRLQQAREEGAREALEELADDVLTAWHSEMVPECVTQVQVADYLRARAHRAAQIGQQR